MKRAKDLENSIIEPPSVNQKLVINQIDKLVDNVNQEEEVVPQVDVVVEKRRSGRPPDATEALEFETSQIITRS